MPDPQVWVFRKRSDEPNSNELKYVVEAADDHIRVIFRQYHGRFDLEHVM